MYRLAILAILALACITARAESDISHLDSGQVIGNRGSIAPLPFVSAANDAAGTAFTFDTVYTRASGDLLDLSNNGTLKFALDYSGAFVKAPQLTDPGTKPTCIAALRGTIFYDAGGVGVADTLEVCAHKSDNTYAWIAMATIP